jgi:biotin synthase
MTFRELDDIYHQPLFDLISQSRAVHLQHWRGEEVQRRSLLSIKTGGCSEDCAYCAQSARYSTGIEREDLLSLEDVMTAAHGALARRNSVLHGGSLAWRARWFGKI